MPGATYYAHRASLATVALCLVPGIAACGAPDRSGEDPVTAAWSQQLLLRISSTDPEFPDEIRDILQEAVNAGEMSFDLYSRGMQAYGSCLEDAGLVFSLVGPVEGGDGLLQYMTQVQYPIGVEIGDPVELTLTALADDCSRLYETPIAMSYVSQPSAIEAREQRFLEYRDSWIACIRVNGGVIESDATEEEIATENNRIAETGVDCGFETGYWTS